MKPIYASIIMLFTVPAATQAQHDEANILSYYAVGNSLDGQLLIDRTNVLRFYPVFAMRGDVDSVHVSIYYGAHLFEQYAKHFDGKKYWQVLLPKFFLGEAIQRMEVEIRIDLGDKYASTLATYQEIRQTLKEVSRRAKDVSNIMKQLKDHATRSSLIFLSKANKLDTELVKLTTFQKDIGNLLAIDTTSIQETKKCLSEWIQAIDTLSSDSSLSRAVASLSNMTIGIPDTMDSLFIPPFDSLKLRNNRDTTAFNSVISVKKAAIEKLKTMSDSLRQIILKYKELKASTNLSAIRKYFDNTLNPLASNQIPGIVNSLNRIKIDLKKQVESADSIVINVKTLVSELTSYASTSILDTLKLGSITARIDSLDLKEKTLRDSVRNRIARELLIGLTDQSYTGPSVTKADIILDDSLHFVRILYRNYKTSLRYMPALDPGEKMGIFRIRYIPFPIVGMPNKTAPRLLKPMSTSSPTVFEVGLAFGDAIVPGDEFVPTEFSWRRLGFAFAITEQLFKDSADVIGLALTYDFNSYGSIGLGGNFAHDEVHPYFSFGINKKAFEVAIKGMASIFK